MIIAVPVGVVSSYFKDWLSTRLASLSIGYRRYVHRRRMTRHRIISELAAEPNLLIIEYIRLVYRTTMFLAALVLALGAPSLLMAAKEHPGLAFPLPFTVPKLSPETRELLFAGLNALTFVFVLLTQYIVSTTLTICSRARLRLVRRTRQLRAIPPI